MEEGNEQKVHSTGEQGGKGHGKILLIKALHPLLLLLF
jgi:hypothetical protein